jgi:hypothetical protein
MFRPHRFRDNDKRGEIHCIEQILLCALSGHGKGEVATYDDQMSRSEERGGDGNQWRFKATYLRLRSTSGNIVVLIR